MAQITDSAIDALVKADADLWLAFGLAPLEYNVIDNRKFEWRKSDTEVQWENRGTYSGDVYGDSVWKNKTHTLCVLDNGCGDRDAYVFLNRMRVK